jgi:hypothetical protein
MLRPVEPRPNRREPKLELVLVELIEPCLIRVEGREPIPPPGIGEDGGEP